MLRAASHNKDVAFINIYAPKIAGIAFVKQNLQEHINSR